MSNNNQELEFQTVKSKRGPGPRGQKVQNKNNKNNEHHDKPRLTFKELLFELNNLKKYQHSPKADLHERSNSYVIRIELPGLSKNDITVQVRDGQFLLISGNKQNLSLHQDDTTIYSECHYGNFMRRIKLSSPVILDTMRTSVSNGVLVVTIDKVPQVEEALDSRLDIQDNTYPTYDLPSIPEDKAIDFKTLNLTYMTGKSWADED
jgi:HSP20 family molecular chaperone IbpA